MTTWMQPNNWEQLVSLWDNTHNLWFDDFTNIVQRRLNSLNEFNAEVERSIGRSYWKSLTDPIFTKWIDWDVNKYNIKQKIAINEDNYEEIKRKLREYEVSKLKLLGEITL